MTTGNERSRDLSLSSRNPQSLAEMGPAQKLTASVINLAMARTDREQLGASIQISAQLAAQPGAIARLSVLAYNHPGLIPDPEAVLRFEPNLAGIRTNFEGLVPRVSDPEVQQILTTPPGHPAVQERVDAQLAGIRTIPGGEQTKAIEILLSELISASRLPISEATFVTIIQGHYAHNALIDHLESNDLLDLLARSESERLFTLGRLLATPIRIIQSNTESPEADEYIPHEDERKHRVGLAAQLRVLSQLRSALTESDDPDDQAKVAEIRTMMGEIAHQLVLTERSLKKAAHPGAPDLSRAEIHHMLEWQDRR